MSDRLDKAIAALVVALSAALVAGSANAQQAIGSTATARNLVTRELSGAAAPLATGDSVYRNEVVRTGTDSLAKLVFLDSTNLAVGPTSRVVLDRFVYEGDAGSEKVAVGLAKGLFRFTTGTLDKKAYTITTPTAAIGVRGTILDIDVRATDTRVTLVEGRALVCPRRNGSSFEQQARNCGEAFGGASARTGRCDCAELDHPGQTASASAAGGKTTASFTGAPVNFASQCGGICSGADVGSIGTVGTVGTVGSTGSSGFATPGPSTLTVRTRDRLISDPGQIAAVIREAATSNARDRADIEAGIAQALAYLKRYDLTGYFAISNYLSQNASDPIVAEIVALVASTSGALSGGIGLGRFSTNSGPPASFH